MRIHPVKLFAIYLLAACMLAGCATQSNLDPLEGVNRGIYKFNDTVDKAVAKPVAKVYKTVLPAIVQKGVNNFFNNIGMVVTAANDILQLKFDHAMEDLGRLVINTTFGVAGLIDLASKDGIERRDEDFGQTLGYWGVDDGAYLILPFFGPSTVRDTAGLAVDSSFFAPLIYLDRTNARVRARNVLLVVGLVDKRAQLLPGSDILDEVALDPYAFVRDAYLQRRHSLINDGNVSQEDLLLEEPEKESEKEPVKEKE